MPAQCFWRDSWIRLLQTCESCTHCHYPRFLLHRRPTTSYFSCTFSFASQSFELLSSLLRKMFRILAWLCLPKCNMHDTWACKSASESRRHGAAEPKETFVSLLHARVNRMRIISSKTIWRWAHERAIIFEIRTKTITFDARMRDMRVARAALALSLDRSSRCQSRFEVCALCQKATASWRSKHIMLFIISAWTVPSLCAMLSPLTLCAWVSVSAVCSRAHKMPF